MYLVYDGSHSDPKVLPARARERLLLVIVGGAVFLSLSDFPLPPNWFQLVRIFATGAAFAGVPGVLE